MHLELTPINMSAMLLGSSWNEMKEDSLASPSPQIENQGRVWNGRVWGLGMWRGAAETCSVLSLLWEGHVLKTPCCLLPLFPGGGCMRRPGASVPFPCMGHAHADGPAAGTVF